MNFSNYLASYSCFVTYNSSTNLFTCGNNINIFPKLCFQSLIKEQLRESQGQCEYAIYIQVLFNMVIILVGI